MKPFVNESAENYLETILMLSKKLPVVRSVDIANELDFKKSSVSVAMKNLREKNHITVTDAGFIYLTESGREIAEMIYERHRLLSDWLIRLGVSEETANEDACRMEHHARRRRSAMPTKRFPCPGTPQHTSADAPPILATKPSHTGAGTGLSRCPKRILSPHRHW